MVIGSIGSSRKVRLEDVGNGRRDVNNGKVEEALVVWGKFEVRVQLNAFKQRFARVPNNRTVPNPIDSITLCFEGHHNMNACYSSSSQSALSDHMCKFDRTMTGMDKLVIIMLRDIKCEC